MRLKVMKIAFVSQPFDNIFLPWTGTGGSIGIWIYEVSRRLAMSCEVTVYTRKDRHQKKVEFNQGVRYQRISTAIDDWYPYLQTHGTRHIGFNIRRAIFFRNIKRPLFASNLYYLTYALQVARDLKKKKYDVVHIINFSQFVPIIRAFNPRIKIVLNMRCEWLTQLDYSMIERRLRDVDLIVGVSHYITEKICNRFPQFSKRCKTVYNGVDVTTFVNEKCHGASMENDIKQLLFVGRVSPEKGLHVLIDAFHEVVSCYPHTQLEIVGPTRVPLNHEWFWSLGLSDKVLQFASSFSHNPECDYYSFLQRQLLSLNIANNVTFTGFLPNQQIIEHYQHADVLINPSFSESFGRSLVEAMSCQVPVIAARTGGMEEIVEDGKTGILVEPDDAQALAQAILYLFAKEDPRKSMGKAARKRVVELFSWERVAENLLCEYKNICDVNE
jgi:glycosyltransferase involved in cell wall biosynthesis